PSLVPGGSLEKKIIIELAGQMPCFPHETKPIQSFIGEYLAKIGRDDLVRQYELEPFDVPVQSLGRTVVDKTYALCDYYVINRCARRSRHVYDLFKILGSFELDEGVARLFYDVRQYRYENPVCYSSRRYIKLHDVMKGIIDSRAYEEDFDTLTSPLLYEEVKYRDCEPTLIKIHAFLEKHSNIIDKK
ncbi:MAG: nucleotidyl transferase AbiEii/AbiGii toxin family protein, partial [Bacilli bacterium]|nr:nucleotidyl transferase AbiEii/AbiGii toxin family protein [Bacilli bacterium]